METFEYVEGSSLAYKARSKKEKYDLLTSKGGIYLPKIQDAHYKFIRQLWL